MKSETLKCDPIIVTNIYFHIYQYQMLKIKKETANIWEYKVSNNDQITNFVRFWKTRSSNLNLMHFSIIKK